MFLGFRTCSLFILISGLLYKANLGLLNMFIGLESQTLIVTSSIARLHTHSPTHTRGTTPPRVLHFSAFHSMVVTPFKTTRNSMLYGLPCLL